MENLAERYFTHAITSISNQLIIIVIAFINIIVVDRWGFKDGFDEKRKP